MLHAVYKMAAGGEIITELSNRCNSLFVNYLRLFLGINSEKINVLIWQKLKKRKKYMPGFTNGQQKVQHPS